MDERIEDTRLRIAQKTAVFCGLVRDCAEHLPRNLATIDSLAGLFQRAHHVLLENDSVDDSLALLEDWHRRSGRTGTVRGLENIQSRYPRRTERLAFLRNACLDICREDPDLAATDYLVILDMDDVNAQLTSERLLRGFAAVEGLDWTAFFANQSESYYDIWALRHPDWSPDDCWTRVEKRPPFMSEFAARQLYVEARHIQIETDRDPFEVDSAFGGLGVYRTRAALASRYDGVAPTEQGLCEHVPFHAGLRANGGRLYIVPEMVNGTGLPALGGARVREGLRKLALRLKGDSVQP